MKMRRFIIIYISLFINLLLFFESKAQITTDNSYKLTRVISYISKYYVDSIHQEELIDAAIIKLLSDLDPHCIYIEKEEVEKVNEPLQGSFDGIGIQFNILNDTIFVIMPISGGPSEKVGIKAGDRIIKIEQDNVAGVGIKNATVCEKLLGEEGTKVNISIKRRENQSLLDFTITRDKIPIYSIDACYMINKSTGYIKINKFSATTHNEFKKAIGQLQSEGLENLILDLRANGGGYLKSSIELADEFLSNNNLIVYTEGINSPRKDYYASNSGNFEKGKLVILIDENSASASEIFTGALQDWDRGIVVGRRSFGKGLVQRPFYLPDGSMIRLTTARYYTPTGRLIQKSYESGKEQYNSDLVNRYNKGELMHKDSIHFPINEKFSTLKNNRSVYGGGGIMPDIFVPIDTSGMSGYYNLLIRKGVIGLFAIHYIDINRDIFKTTFSKFKDFKNKFDVTQSIVDELIAFAKNEGIKFNENDFLISNENINLTLKANIALNIWGTSEYYEILNQKNPAFLKALEVIESKVLYSQHLRE
jgi:carboxyl-terminal processing protease